MSIGPVIVEFSMLEIPTVALLPRNDMVDGTGAGAPKASP